MIVLVPAVLVLFFRAFRMRGSGWRAACLQSVTTWSLLAVAFTEGLSLAGWLAPGALAGAWFGVAGLLLAVIARDRATRGMAPRDPLPSADGRAVDLVLIGATGVLVALVGLTAVMSPPNTWDALQYHMPRVVHWLGRGSVHFYPTHDMKQLHMPPGAEYLILQIHALGGGDRFDGLVQWVAFVGCVLGASLIAQALGADRRGQVLTAVACATIPNAILPASGAKNDCVLALWLVVLSLHLIRYGDRPGRGHALAIGAGLGLAILTKGTAYVFAAPVVAALFLGWPRASRGAFLRHLPLIAAVVLALNGPHYARNVELYGSPLGPGYEGSDPRGFRYAVERLSPSSVLSGVLRNVSLHLGTPRKSVNEAIAGAIEQTLRWVGEDVNDPATTWTATRFAVSRASWRHESLAGSPAHVALIAIALALLAARPRRHSRATLALAAGVTLGFIAFCAVLKWQSVHARLHAPLLVLWSPVVGVVLGHLRPRVLPVGVATALLALAVPLVIGNQLRPLIGGSSQGPSVFRRDRSELYFTEQPHLAAPFRQAVAEVERTGCRRIGLDLTARVGDQLEYLLLALLHIGPGGREVQAMGVTNASARYRRAGDDRPPCVIVCVWCLDDPAKSARYAAGAAAVHVFKPVVVFVGPKGSAASRE
jgi:4-amino-4-deoxy-L-arabinose transferase-like glycosyltransferase